MRSCPYCQAITRQVKAIQPEGGAQQYRCMHCNRLYVLEPEGRSDKRRVPEKNVPVQIPVTAAPVMSANTVDELPPTLAPKNVEAATPVARTFPGKEGQSLLSRLVDWASTTNSWGRLPEIAVLQSASLLLLAWAFTERRAASGASHPFLWITLAMLIVPAAFRLASAEPARRERIGLVLLVGLSFYLVKVMYSPLAFTFPDELSHIRNVNEILATHRLFQQNPILPVTAYYPGLAIVTSTLASLSGLSTFSAGVVVIGIARLILFLALFLLYEQVSGSARIAGLAALLYIANPNFLYWISEFSYEPLALPLLTLVLLAVARREMATERRRRLAWTVVALLGILSVVITHHMTSYIMTGLLIVLVAFYAIRSRGKEWGPWGLALVAVVATSSWLIFVANLTINYLSPVLLGAIRGLFNMISQEQQSRALFTSRGTGSVAPIWEQVVSLGSVALIALGLPFGLFEIWKNHRNKMFALLLGAIGLVYLPMLVLRLTQGGWETANRSSEFLFIGIGFVIALAIDRFWIPKWSGWKSQSVLVALAVTLFFGGLIAGWPPRARWPRPYAVSTGSYLIEPQVVSVSQWMLSTLGPNHRIAASKADAKLLNAYNQDPFTDNAAAINKMFFAPRVGGPETHALLKRDIEYVMSDRKMISWDHMLGYFFYNRLDDSSAESQLVDLPVFEKFDGIKDVNRMLDAGDIVVYDVTKYLAAKPKISTTSSTP